ncbi:hypothetical protein [Streptomyces sp. NBC_01022]|uniref:hypothetical protein n=1 Tax=Streptomyces sp. NBC_01022 TaxID=2903723 RepID=UPI002DD81C2B|nr:hypothetical protein [Streptomyces sp. NBC_01022]WRZ87434.1 hypothetical protein OG316_25555 [Streptomyces sp. NBC_01022]
MPTRAVGGVGISENGPQLVARPRFGLGRDTEGGVVGGSGQEPQGRSLVAVHGAARRLLSEEHSDVGAEGGSDREQ